MLSLIGREIRDHLVYVVSPCVVSLIVIGIAICTFLWGIEEASVGFCGILAIVLFIGFSILGAAQMYLDRSNRTSALLSTLAVTRSQILAARVIVGVLTVLGSLVPAFFVAIVLLRLFAPPLEFYSRMVVEISITLTLMGFLCYCIGLQVGWTANRSRLVLGVPLLAGLCISLIAIKGFGPEAMLILVVLIAALLVRTWSQFVSASL